MPRILAFAGSLRRDSWNKKLVTVAAAGAREAGAEVSLFDMRDYPLPVYDGDDEKAHGLPENALRLKELFKAHDGLLLASPEYNSSYPGGLKNLIDWVSRPREGEKPLEAFRGKPAGILAASPGAKGGMRMLPHLRDLLANLQMIVVPGMYGLAHAAEAFDAEGNLTDEKVASAVKGLGRAVVDMASRLA